MTTYVVALIVSEFTCDKANNEFSDVSIRICGPGDQIKKLEYAKSMTPRILNYFDKEYFKVNYPLPKLDLASIPDFRFGAMENWGLVTFREMYLLYDKDESTTSNKMTICSIIAHELAHMVKF
jgi:aminopeptidase N